MEQLRLVDTDYGTIFYVFQKKQVKNLNLHIERDGMAVLSVPMKYGAKHADEFIRTKAHWIIKGRERVEHKSKHLPAVLPRKEECVRILRQALNQAYPMTAPLGVKYPILKVRKMTSQWGNCHYKQGYITLNSALAGCPEELRVYVALHELIHFLHPNHGPGFYACMDSLMPNWKEWNTELKNYTDLL